MSADLILPVPALYSNFFFHVLHENEKIIRLSFIASSNFFLIIVEKHFELFLRLYKSLKNFKTFKC